MNRRALHRVTSGVLTLSLLSLTASRAGAASGDRTPTLRPALNAPCLRGETCIDHVLLISVDGMHEIDLARYVAFHPHSALAMLSARGKRYVNAFTPAPSDSFPGLVAQVTGGNPVTTGVYYDDSYDKTLFKPGSACRGARGTEVLYDESIDRNSTELDAGGGIDPAKLPLALTSRGCVPVYPHSYLRVDTIFEAIRRAGGYTAWSDKHPAYDLVNGPSGAGVDDLYDPEIAATDGTEPGTQAYDALKVAAVINEIHGRTHDGAARAPVPNILGMNFQALSVAQKLATGGYENARAEPSPEVASALEFVDASLAKMLRALEERGLRRSTAIIVSAKHGQTPIDRTLRRIVDDTLLATTVPNADQITADDIALLWFEESTEAVRAKAIAALELAAQKLGISTVFDGAHPPRGFAVAPHDPRAPDIIVRPLDGVIYAGKSATKIAEHGGFNPDDRHVALLVAYPGAVSERVFKDVETTEIAPTILGLLGIDPHNLAAVRAEGTPLLPGIFAGP